MSTLSEIAALFPNARISVTLSNRSTKPRRQPREGDRKYTKRRGWLIRLQQRSNGYCCVRNGRPLWEWVPESEIEPTLLNSLHWIGRANGLMNPAPL